MPFLQVSGISLAEAGNFVLQDISYTQQKFQKIAIAGETGSGKSTLLQTIAGLVQPASGEVRFENQRVKGPQEQLLPGHPGISYLSQQFELPRFLRVEQVLKYANKLPDEQAATLYNLCRINHLMTRRTDHLSGGERQRIALARLLIAAPKLLLLDEPFSNLDIIHKNVLKSIIHDIGEILDITLALISHDPLDTLSWADQILVMKAGQIIQQGSPEQIYRQPVNEYTAALFGNYNVIPAERAHAIAGLSAPNRSGKNLLIRPENIKIVAAENNNLVGKIKSVHFFGAYYEVEVSFPEIKMQVKTETLHFIKGDAVSIAVLPEALWYM